MKAPKSLQWKLLPKNKRLNLELALGDFRVSAKSARKMGPELTRMTLEKGELQLRIMQNPLKTFIENREKIKVFFSVKERHTFLIQEIKKHLLADVRASGLTLNQERTLNEAIGFLDKLGEEQLLSLLNTQQRRTREEFVQYLVDNKSRLIGLRQLELDEQPKTTGN